MAGARIPKPLGLATNAAVIDPGTAARITTPPPGPSLQQSAFTSGNHADPGTSARITTPPLGLRQSASTSGDNTTVAFVVHRSGLSFTAIHTSIYVVTFSVIQNGKETTLQTAHEYYMYTNSEISAIGYNDLDKKPEYSLQWSGMSKHPEWPNTVQIYGGVFLHPAAGPSDLGGCVGFCRQEDATRDTLNETNDLFTVPFSKSKEAMQDLRDIYDNATKTLTGAKFLLKTKSTAAASRTPTPMGPPPPDEDTPK